MITIGMPVFNDVDFIEESINSILNQTYKNFVLVISDDGSTDGCAEICKKYASIDSRINYIRQERNLGISKNMEFLLQLCATPYFMWAADDDLWAPDFVENLLQLLLDKPQAVVAFSKYIQIEQQTKIHVQTIDIDYYRENKVESLQYFIEHPDDGFGYGLFRVSLVRGVRFPNWWWPCHKTALNNIFPSLCYYLLRGQYLHYNKEALFFKRVKTEEFTNHTISSGNSKLELIKYMIRRFYLCCYTFKILFNLLQCKDRLKIARLLIMNWFFNSIFKEIRLAFK